METSILTSTKKVLGLAADYTAFDEDVMIHINSAFSTLTQLGIGPSTGFMIEDRTSDWSEFVDMESDPQFNSIKSYVFLKTKMLFDPPQTSFVIDALNKQIEELEWRLNVHREETGYTDPDPQPPPEFPWWEYFYGDQVWTN